MIELSPAKSNVFHRNLSWLQGCDFISAPMYVSTSQSSTPGGSYCIPRSPNLLFPIEIPFSGLFLFSITFQILLPFSLSQSNLTEVIKVTSTCLEQYLITNSTFILFLVTYTVVSIKCTDFKCTVL